MKKHAAVPVTFDPRVFDPALLNGVIRLEDRAAIGRAIVHELALRSPQRNPITGRWQVSARDVATEVGRVEIPTSTGKLVPIQVFLATNTSSLTTVCQRIIDALEQHEAIARVYEFVAGHRSAAAHGHEDAVA